MGYYQLIEKTGGLVGEFVVVVVAVAAVVARLQTTKAQTKRKIVAAQESNGWSKPSSR